MKPLRDQGSTARGMGKAACAALICLAVFAPSPTFAASSTPPAGSGSPSLMVALDYVAAAGCPDAAQYKAVVQSRLGHDPFGEGVPDRVSVRISARGRDYEGHIEWRDAQGNWVGDRTFPSHSDDCGELVRAMGFALALQIQLSITPGPQAKARPDTSEPAAEARDDSRPPDVRGDERPERKEVVVPDLVATSPTRAARPDFFVGVGSLLGFGTSSSPVPFGRLFGTMAWTHLLLELGAEVAWPSTVSRADGAGFLQEQLLLSLAGCAVILPWNACLVTKGGGIRIAGEGVDRPASSIGPSWEAGLRLTLVQPLGRHVYLAARGEALVMLTKWSAELDGHSVFTSRRLLETVGLDIGVRLP